MTRLTAALLIAGCSANVLNAGHWFIGIGTPNPKPGQNPGFLGSTFLKRINAGDMAVARDAILMRQKPASIVARRVSANGRLGIGLFPFSSDRVLLATTPRLGRLARQPPRPGGFFSF
ncbi:hypothetical protein C0214_07810 [Methylobacterium sp. DM1]|nr:hypothetical protein C0214_07810 [Methylobacterium sp. DM1]